MENNTLEGIMDITMSKIKEMIDVNTIVGEPISTLDGITLIPVSKVSVGFATGGSDFPVKEQKNGFGAANGAGIKIVPVAFLVIKDGGVRMINIAPPAGTTVDRLVEMIPVAIDKVQDLIEKHKKDEI